MTEYKLLTTVRIGNANVKNRLFMSPMTRCRIIENLPNKLMPEFMIPGGNHKEKNEAEIENVLCNNPDLEERFENDFSLSQDLKTDLFFSEDEEDIADDPFFKDR
jgi:hypothetical protein